MTDITKVCLKKSELGKVSKEQSQEKKLIFAALEIQSELKKLGCQIQFDLSSDYAAYNNKVLKYKNGKQ